MIRTRDMLWILRNAHQLLDQAIESPPTPETYEFLSDMTLQTGRGHIEMREFIEKLIEQISAQRDPKGTIPQLFIYPDGP